MTFLQKTGRLLFSLREYFFPAGCALCGTALAAGEETWYGLCENCRISVEPDAALDRAGSGEYCSRCGKPLVSEEGCCLSCRNSTAPAFDRIVTLFPYSGRFRRLLQSYKFGKNLALGNFFAEKIQEVLNGFEDTSLSPEPALPRGPLIVPVPPRPGKIRKTGWDQVEYLAKLLERENPVSRCLKRLPSKIQKELNREDRITNLRGRIILKYKAAAKTAVVIDDVITTGSTIDVCAETLKKGGAEKVYGICLFYG